MCRVNQSRLTVKILSNRRLETILHPHIHILSVERQRKNWRCHSTVYLSCIWRPIRRSRSYHVPNVAEPLFNRALALFPPKMSFGLFTFTLVLIAPPKRRATAQQKQQQQQHYDDALSNTFAKVDYYCVIETLNQCDGPTFRIRFFLCISCYFMFIWMRKILCNKSTSVRFVCVDFLLLSGPIYSLWRRWNCINWFWQW